MAATPHPHWEPNPVSDIPPQVQEALKTALHMEGEPDTWFNDMAWIMAQESDGKVGIKNPTSSAAGLFQLTSVNYPLMPRGKASIGDAVDECRGGIRYVRQRYHTAQAARLFWEQHDWY